MGLLRFLFSDERSYTGWKFHLGVYGTWLDVGSTCWGNVCALRHRCNDGVSPWELPWRRTLLKRFRPLCVGIIPGATAGATAQRPTILSCHPPSPRFREAPHSPPSATGIIFKQADTPPTDTPRGTGTFFRWGIPSVAILCPWVRNLVAPHADTSIQVIAEKHSAVRSELRNLVLWKTFGPKILVVLEFLRLRAHFGVIRGNIVVEVCTPVIRISAGHQRYDKRISRENWPNF